MRRKCLTWIILASPALCLFASFGCETNETKTYHSVEQNSESEPKMQSTEEQVEVLE